MEEHKLIEEQKPLHTESPEEIENILIKKVGGEFADGTNLDMASIKSSPEIEIDKMKLKEQIDQKMQQINNVELQYANLSKDEKGAKEDLLIDELTVLIKKEENLQKDYLYKQTVVGVDDAVNISPKKGGLEAARDLAIILTKTIDMVNKKMSDDYKKLEKYQEDLSQSEEDIMRLRAGVDVDFLSRGMTEKLSIQEKLNLLAVDVDILKERIPVLEESLHKNQERMRVLINIVNPEAKTS